MKNIANIEQLKKYFNFLVSTSTFNFKIKDVEDYNYALYAKFTSNNVGIYFIYEFRESIPQIQFTKLDESKLEVRKGLYTIKELYKDESFKLQSFYLDEILSFKKQENYKTYFQNAKTIEDAIRVSSELIQTYAMDFVGGDELSYMEIDQWFRLQVIKSCKI